MHSDILQVVLITDGGLLRPTLFTMWSMLRHSSEQLKVHFWGDGLTTEEWKAVETVASGASNCDFHPRAITPDELAGAQSQASHISAATMGRLFIPRHLSGRVLYLDGDVAVTGDVAPLRKLGLAGKPLGAVRDFMTAKRASRRERDAPPAEYFNAGVLLMDCDALRNRPEGLDRLEDVAHASSLRMGDQDHLNLLYPGEAHLLNPAYNSSWGRTAEQRGFVRRLGGHASESALLPDVMVHFHGPKKPWKRDRFDLWSQRARAVRAYRRDMGAYTRAYPALSF
ncbi:glycosyltransferase family 8 protein [Pseudooceanicola nanhaiensis]|uniref:glycosyltransferase family 8 protein n=1 Tax=Pseudooceanicola nanhaiensis TaxID=375761 RepID=UPI001CD4037F|nr:glycosyltransferase [Pseudooceanicola nanhaiensis]MCA0922747.1 lipopolysaccharide 3-alpha-galactosyltransferase [Pseudooceanicola nanhaiensis]